MSNSSRPIIVWCGQMTGDDGYGAAARAHVKGLKRMNVPHVAIDTRTLKTFGTYDQASVAIEQKGKLLTIRTVDASTPLAAVVHLPPDQYVRVGSRGRTRRVGYSHFGAATVPADWANQMVSMDEIWTLNEMDRAQLLDARIPAWMTHVLHRPVDVDRSLSGFDRPPRWGRKTVFLSSSSELARLDLRVLFEAFSEAFDQGDDVLLVLKIRPGERGLVQEAFISSMITNPGRRSGTWPSIELIETDLTREQMLRLHAGADAYVSTERGDGWFGPAIDSMALEVPVVTFDWGGSRELFLDESDCYVVPVSDHLVYGRDGVNAPESLYDEHLWPGVDPRVLAGVLKDVASDINERRRRGRLASKRILEILDPQTVTGRLQQLVRSWQVWDFGSDAPAVVEVVESGSAMRPSRSPATSEVLDHRLIGLLNEPAFLQLMSPREWVSAYKRVTRFAHEHRDQLPDASLVKDPVGKAMATPTSKPFRKARAVLDLRAAGRRAADAVGGRNFPIEIVETMDDYDNCVSGKRSRYNAKQAVDRRRKVWSRFRGVESPDSDRKRLAELRSRRGGERVFILDAPLNLEEAELSRLSEEYTFGVNDVFPLLNRIDWRPTYYTLLDWDVAPAVAGPLEHVEGMTRFYPERFRGLLPANDDTYWYWPRPVGDTIAHQFTPDATKGIPSQGTALVTAIQLAFHLGFRDIVLLGVPSTHTNSAIAKDVRARLGTGSESDLESTAHGSSNIFDASGVGRDPTVNDMKRMLIIMRKGVERYGGQLRNATIGGELDVLERLDLETLFD